MMRHELHAVADAEHGHTQGKNAGIGLIVGVINGIGAAGEDDAFGVKGFDVGERHIVGVQFAIDMRLAYAAGNQLRDLRAEIEDKEVMGFLYINYINLTSCYSQKDLIFYLLLGQ